ncbi:MAG: LD-carboxypeptidase [Ignavibacteriae bacterium]|nr:LD-carboxypeptidase [Ignavibacteriota bacterium]
MIIQKPKALKKNATIGVISPASPQRDSSRLDRGVSYLERCGYHVELGRSARNSWGGYLAGTDEERRSDIEEMFANPNIDAIFCARGGYGTSRLLHQLDYDVIRKNPKIVVGFSDTTALQSAIFRKTGLVTFSGAMPSVDMADTFNPFAEEWFWGILSEPKFYQKNIINGERFYNGGAKGKLYCCNLSVMTTLFGTPYTPDWNDGILLVEDIGEDPYRIDRMLSHCENIGLWKELAGLCFGQFTASVVRQSSVPERPMNEVLKEYSERAKLPCLGNILYGHQSEKVTLPFGAQVQIAQGSAALKLIESPLSD